MVMARLVYQMNREGDLELWLCAFVDGKDGDGAELGICFARTEVLSWI